MNLGSQRTDACTSLNDRICSDRLRQSKASVYPLSENRNCGSEYIDTEYTSELASSTYEDLLPCQLYEDADLAEREWQSSASNRCYARATHILRYYDIPQRTVRTFLPCSLARALGLVRELWQYQFRNEDGSGSSLGLGFSTRFEHDASKRKKEWAANVCGLEALRLGGIAAERRRCAEIGRNAVNERADLASRECALSNDGV
nr:hypothetical protein Iba_chr03dCG8550 [Ipomoea batatas]